MSKKILVVDDEPAILLMVASRLKANNYDVATAQDGNAALELINHFNPDLILIDVMMPPPDGFTVCKTLKNDDAFKHIPIILLTAKAGEKELQEYMGCGADDYITKPYQPEDLIAKVEKYIS